MKIAANVDKTFARKSNSTSDKLTKELGEAHGEKTTTDRATFGPRNTNHEHNTNYLHHGLNARKTKIEGARDQCDNHRHRKTAVCSALLPLRDSISTSWYHQRH